MNDTETDLPAPPELTPTERKELKARAHHLNPVVMVGDAGLTPAVVAEAARAIAVHHLIKVRVAGDDRDERRAVMQALCTQLAAAPVQIIGKQLILYRPASMEDAGGTGRIKRSGPYVPKKTEADATEHGVVRTGERKGATLKGTKGAKARKAFAEMVASSPKRRAEPSPRGARAGASSGDAPRRATAATARGSGLAGRPSAPGNRATGGPASRPTSAAARPARPGTAAVRTPSDRVRADRTPSDRAASDRTSSDRSPAARAVAPRAPAARAPASRATAPRAAAPRAIGGLRPRGTKSKG